MQNVLNIKMTRNDSLNSTNWALFTKSSRESTTALTTRRKMLLQTVEKSLLVCMLLTCMHSNGLR